MRRLIFRVPCNIRGINIRHLPADQLFFRVGRKICPLILLYLEPDLRIGLMHQFHQLFIVPVCRHDRNRFMRFLLLARPAKRPHSEGTSGQPGHGTQCDHNGQSPMSFMESLFLLYHRFCSSHFTDIDCFYPVSLPFAVCFVSLPAACHFPTALYRQL